jgi:hypothetical protein
MVLNVKITILWVVTPFSLVGSGIKLAQRIYMFTWHNKFNLSLRRSSQADVHDVSIVMPSAHTTNETP